MAEQLEPKVKIGSDGGLDEDMSAGTDVDGGMDHSAELRMEAASPSSELDRLSRDNSDNDSMKSGKEGMYVINAGKEQTNGEHIDNYTDKDNDNNNSVSVTNGAQDDIGELDSSKTNVIKKKDRRVTDSFLLEKRPAENKVKLNESFSESRPSSVASSGKSGTPSKDTKGDDSKKLYMIWSGKADPIKKEKDKEREEKIRQAQLKLAEERQKKIEEMREQQRLAQENREKQLEARRRKIEELKRREDERRKQVEDRRKTQEEIDKAKKEAILSKAKERLTRYEQWKTGGRKGGRRHVLGFGSRTPRDVCLPLDSRRSSSQSTLRRSPNNSDFDSYFNRRAVSASSVVRRHCCIDINKLTQGTGIPGDSPPSKKLSQSTSVLYHKRSPQFSSSGDLIAVGPGNLKSGAESLMASAPPTRHKSSVNLTSGVVKMRERSSPRKPRPSSVATSMPSFVRVEGDSPKSSRSKSSDRSPRDGSKSRGVPRQEEDAADGQQTKAATLPRPYDRKKIEERRLEVKKKQEERKEREKEKEKERMSKSEVHEESQDMGKPPARLSRSFMERMAAPKHPSPKREEPVKEVTPVKVIKRSGPIEAPVAPKQQAKTPMKDKLKVNKDSPAKVTDEVKMDEVKIEEVVVEPTPIAQSDSPAPSDTPPSRITPTIQVEEVKDEVEPEIDVRKEDTMRTPSPLSDRTQSPSSDLGVEHETSEAQPSPARVKFDTKPPTAAESRPSPKEGKPKTDKEREMEEYKAKLAEKRRVAREKAEREAEIERLRQEEQQRQEEERERLEEERQRREEEEALRLAAEARRQEEERLQRAIETEEKRRREEAERQEQERVAREEADRKAKEEAERREKEMSERAKREEEERTERRKRLEMIMKRVKTDTPTTTPEKGRNDSPTRVITGSSSRTSLVSSEDEKSDEVDKDEKPDGLLRAEEKTEDAPKFKSPLLQKLTDKSQNVDSGTPKFKSPLLQSIMGKTKIGARLSGTRLEEMDKSTENLTESKSSERLSEKESSEKEDSDKDKDTLEPQTNGVDSSQNIDSVEEDTDFVAKMDFDAHENVPVSVTSLEGKYRIQSDSMVGSVPNTDGITDSQMLIGSTADSAVCLSFTNGITTSQNGDIHIEQRGITDSKEFIDSSISVRTVDSPDSPSHSESSVDETLEEESRLTPPPSDSALFEEVIDLSRLPSKPLKSGTGPRSENLLNHSGDHSGHSYHVDHFGVLDNGHFDQEEDSGSHVPLVRPIIAFDDNAARQDVPDLLS